MDYQKAYTKCSESFHPKHNRFRIKAGFFND